MTTAKTDPISRYLGEQFMAGNTVAIPQITLPVGIRVVGPVAIPVGALSLTYSFDTTQHLNTGVTLTVRTFVSLDNGATWKLVSSGQRPGGVVTGDGGVVVNTFGESFGLAESANPNRQLKFEIECDNGSFTTAGGSIVLT